MDSRSPPSSSGLFKRASSLAVSDVPESGPSAVEIESGDAAPLLRQGSDAAGSNSSSTTGAAAAAATIDNCDVLSQEEQFRMIGHVALSFLFLMLGSSIVPLFAAAEKEAWRSQNIPYQQTRAGDVILDFELNYPLVLPATITSTCYSCRYQYQVIVQFSLLYNVIFSFFQPIVSHYFLLLTINSQPVC